MSAPGQSLRDQFTATRGRAAQGGLSLEELAGGGGGGAQTATPARPPAAGEVPPRAAAAPPPANQPDLPLGLKVSNFVRGVGASFADIPRQMEATSTAALDDLKNDLLHPTVQQKLIDGLTPFFPTQGARIALDLTNYVLSPLTGAATSIAGRPLETFTGLPREITGNVVSGLLPVGGEFKLGASAAEQVAARTMKILQDARESAAAARSAGAAGAKPEAAAKPAGAAKPDLRAFDIAGEHPGANLKVTPELRAKAADFLNGKGTSPIDVHLEQLADPATRSEAVNDIAKIIPKDGVKPIDVTMLGAYALNMTPEEVMASLRPQFPSDEKFAAAVMAQNAAAEQFWNFARTAKETGAPEDFEKATRAYALFNEFSGAWREGKTDWGRAGRIQQEAGAYRSDFAKHIQKMVEDVGGDNVEEVIRRAAELDDPRKVSPFVQSLRWVSSREGMMYVWYNWLISHAVIPKKIASDAGLALFNVGTRYWAEKFGSGAVKPGETAQLIYGYLGSTGDALRIAAKALKSGQSQFHGEYQSLFDGRLLDRAQKMANGAPEGFGENAVTHPAMEYLRMALPTSAIGALDDLAKVMNYRAEVRAMAFRQAQTRFLTPNGADSDAVAAHIRSVMDNVPRGIHEEAVARALRNTLQEPLDGIAASLQSTVDQLNIPIRGTSMEIPLGRILVPFTKIMSNSMRFAYRSSPLVHLFPSGSFRAEIAAGGARRDLAMAQAGLGTAVSAIFGVHALGGGMTGAGPSSPDLRATWQRAGNKPYHIQIGPLSFEYERIEPLGMTLGTIADTFDLMRYAHDEDNAQLSVSLALGIGHAVLDKTYMQTVGELLEAMDAPDAKGQRFAQNFLTGFAVPNELNLVTRALDPWRRAHNDLTSSIASRTPGFSAELPPLRNIWGDALKREDGFPGTALGRAFSPVPFNAGDKVEPIDKWIWEHRSAFPDGDQGRIGLTVPPRTLSFENGPRDSDQVELSLQQLDRLRVLAGNGLKNPSTGLGAKDALNALVTGEFPNREIQQQWNRAGDERRALMILNLWGGYRTGAKNQLLGEDAGLRDAIRSARQGKAALLQQPSVEGTP